MSTNLKKYKIVDAKGINKVYHGGRFYSLDTLTDTEAEVLHDAQCPIIEKIAVLPKAKKGKDIEADL